MCRSIIGTSCETIKHQLALDKVDDFSKKKGIGISPDPLEGGAYNLLWISTTPERRVCEDEANPTQPHVERKVA